MSENDSTAGAAAARNLLSILKGYFLDGSQVAPIVRIARCPECGEPSIVKMQPILNSRLLTTVFFYGTAYDIIDEHLGEKHDKCLNIRRSRFVRNSTISCLTRMYGRANA